MDVVSLSGLTVPATILVGIDTLCRIEEMGGFLDHGGR
jgi:hypothetical protein